MCDTLITTPHILPMINHKIDEYDQAPKYSPESKPSITEPDNGHKTDKVNKIDLHLESERLRTFTNFRSNAVTAEDLAKSGFYFLNSPTNPDLVKCAFCNAEICRWEAGDDAFEEHTKWSPSCPFVKEKQSQRSLHSFLRRSLPPGQDVCGTVEMFPNSVPEAQTFQMLQKMISQNHDVKVRLESFKNWPTSSKQKPELLAEAGFYYRGMEDHTICFECGGALRDWKDDDDPWEQHAMWFPRCKFLLDQKGQEFVEEVQQKLKSNNVTKEEKESKEGKLSESELGASASRDDGVLLCKICDVNERNVIFIPCKHILACKQCSMMMEKCPVCRKRIDETMKVFLS